MSQNVISVVYAVLDRAQLTLYKVDGTTVVIPQGDPRVQRIIDEVTPILAPGNGAVATVDISNENFYSKYEEKSLGFVKLFRMAKSVLAALTGQNDTPKTLGPVTLGSVDAVTKAQNAVREIMQNATPVSSPKFNDDDMDSPDSEDTIVAVVDGKVVSGVENLRSQISHSVGVGNSTVGMDNFLRRVASVADKRNHSVQDLLNFMKRGDLPIADDGSIVIYKALNRKDGKYVDIHSGRVPQQVGSFVHMDESLVDPDRRNECSNGLHVARRQYLSGFRGSVCVIAKVNPEDAIAVPAYDANKMRVCGYHILFELSGDDYQKVLANKPFTDGTTGQKMLGAVISGNHTGITEYVKITGQRGTGIVITPVSVAGDPVVPVPEVERLAQALGDNEKLPAPAVDLKAVNQKVTETKVLSRADKAHAIYAKFNAATDKQSQKQYATELLDFKRAAKVGWATLGLPSDTTEILDTYIAD